jgi:hypothetical protein
MRAAFVTFYEDTVNRVEPPARTFDDAAFAFFDEKGANPGAVDEFFNAFTPLWTQRLAVGAWGPAATVWTWALRPALAWESSRAQRLHKGTAFYFSAMTAILAGDIDGGYLYAHRGLEEDRLTHGVLTPATPSLSLVAMDSDNVNQAFRPWVLEKARFVNASLVAYQQGRGRALDFQGLRAKLLERVDCIEPTFLFSYCVARLRRLDSMMPGGSDSDFASQLRLNILFDLTLVTDDVLRRLAPGKWKFIDLAVALASRVPMTLDKAACEPSTATSRMTSTRPSPRSSTASTPCRTGASSQGWIRISRCPMAAGTEGHITSLEVWSSTAGSTRSDSL